MKKGNYFVLQFILSAVLIAMGALLEWKGKNIIHGMPYILFVIPGAIILLGFFIEFIKLKHHYLYILLYIVICGIADAVVVSKFAIETNKDNILMMLGIMALAVGMATTFHFIYDNIRHPDRLIRF